MEDSTEAAGDDGRGPRRIGEVFVEHGFVTGEQLDAALELQRRKGGHVGELLIELGCTTRLDLASALTEYWEPTQPDRRRLSPSLSGAAQDDSAAGLAERLDCLDERLDELARVSSADAVAVGVRLRGAEIALGSLEAIAARLSVIEERLEGLETLEQRFDSVVQLVGRLRDELVSVAGRPTIEHPVARVLER
jgi:hypothetical protein